MRRLCWVLRAAAIFTAVVVAGLIVLVAGIEFGCRGPDVQAAASRRSPAFIIDEPGYGRDAASTYFTFPEWYIVYAAEDLGNFVAERDDSGFAYFSSIAGFWRSFCDIKKIATAPPATDVIVMIYTIGVSFTAEYAIKAAYENTIGRVTEWWRGSTLTAEDQFAHLVALDYAKFLYALPWYEYPFSQKLKELWTDLPVGGGPSLLRKWERRAALSIEYAVKAGYGWLIQKLMGATGGEDVREIMFIVRDLSLQDLALEPQIKVIKDLGGGNSLVRTPRYQVFTEIAIALSRKGRVILEIAGNHDILMTVILPPGAAPRGLIEAISMPLAAKPGFRRAGYVVKVQQLVDVIRDLDRAEIAVEHLFDY